MAITPNYSWPLPDNTSLVKDGAEAIRDLGNAIDTTVDGLPSGGLVHIETVTFSTVSSISVNDVFTSTFDNYLFLVNNLFGTASSTAQGTLRLRVGGVDNSSNIYFDQTLAVNGATISSARTTSTAFNNFRYGLTDESQITAYISRPALALRTQIQYQVNRGFTTSPRIDINQATHNLESAFDGFTLFAQSGTITGSISLYGFAKV